MNPSRWALLALRANVLVAVVLGCGLLAAGRLADSSTLVAEGWHTLGDGVLGLLSMYAAMLSARGADAEHPYGREKFEHLAGAVVGGVLVALAAELCVDFGGHLISGAPHRPAFSNRGATAVLTLAAARIGWALTLSFIARRTRSIAAAVEAQHVRTDAVITSLAVAAALGAQWAIWVDAAGTLCVIGMLGASGVGLVREHAPWLADRSVVAVASIESAIDDFGDYRVRRARSRGTPDRAFIEVTVETEQDLSLRDVTSLATSMESAIQARIPAAVDVTVVVCAARA